MGLTITKPVAQSKTAENLDFKSAQTPKDRKFEQAQTAKNLIFRQAQTHVSRKNCFVGNRLQLCQMFEIGGKQNIDVTSCCVLSNGKMVFCKGRIGYYSLVIHSLDGGLVAEIPIKYYPVDVTPIDDRRVAVTTGRHILIIDIVNFDIVETIKTNAEIWGVAYRDGFLVSCVEGQGLNKTDIKTWESTPLLQEKLITPSYITIFGDKIAFTESYNKKTVRVYNSPMSEIWRITDSKYLQRPNSIDADKDGNLYVIDMKTKSVVVISADGQYHATMNSDIEFKACCLSFDLLNGQLLVCTLDSKALIFDVIK